MTRRSLVVAALSVAVCAIAWSAGANVNPYYDAKLPHHRPDGFVNLDPGVNLPVPVSDFLRWKKDRIGKSVADPKIDLSPVAPELDFIRNNHGAHGEFAVTWIGHATALIQIGGLNILTDPQFSERAFPVQWAGPKRRQAPGVAMRDLPHIDAVLISHNHYDHLDVDSVRALNAQPGGAPLFVVPLGIERWLADAGISNVRALDWWQSVELSGVQVHLVPAQHWSRRGWSDTMQTLWGGFVAAGGGRRVYFAGDTGYSATVFKDIGSRLGPFDLALLPIGAYEPRWFMGPQHVNPADAVQMHVDLQARRSLAIHWGTFQLTDEPLDQPLADLANTRDAKGVAADDFFVLRHGATWRAKQGEAQ